ncbi:unnamed protein product [Clavelina lepadiformis]|uniref:Uncharacterized protein n=1 Tax=Clavelina lepadiformis TaxID=159417 RepID=A0ABP0FEW9_CLALP
MYQHVTHIIFDMDGLLLNTEELYTIAFQNMCRPHGKSYTWDIKIKCMGKKAQDGARYVIDALDLPLTVDQWMEQLHDQLESLFTQAKLMPGAEKLISHLKSHNVPMGICSGSTREGYLAKTTHHRETFSIFSPVVLCGSDEDVKQSKPHPDPYNVARSRFDPVPSAGSILVFEDSPNGVESGIAADMQVVMVPDPNIPHDLTTKSTLVLNSLEEFKPELFGLPPYQQS